MTFLIWVLGIYLFFKIFGKFILQFAAIGLVKKAGKMMDQQTQNMKQNYGGDPYHERIRVDDEIEINIPKNQSSKSSPSFEDLAEDIEFEEVQE